jgi:hypothetical protein
VGFHTPGALKSLSRLAEFQLRGGVGGKAHAGLTSVVSRQRLLVRQRLSHASLVVLFNGSNHAITDFPCKNDA